MPASDAEIETLRFHLGYGNIGVGAQPYTSDGFKDLFYTVIAPNLSEGASTTAVTEIAVAGLAVVTPASMTGIAAYMPLVVDVGEDAERIIVRSTTPTSFRARFTKAHPEPGYPIAVESGLTRLRGLLFDAHASHKGLTDGSIAKTAGLKSVGRGAVEWYGGAAGSVLDGKLEHYLTIIGQLSSLVRVEPIRPLKMGVSKLEAM